MMLVLLLIMIGLVIWITQQMIERFGFRNRQMKQQKAIPSN